MASKLTLTGVMAEHARNKAHPGLVLPKIKDYQLKTFGPDSDRDPCVIHPSEMAKPDWCLRATYMRITTGTWPEEKYDAVRENIFAAGNYIHEKYQDWMIEAGFPLWGDWQCRVCKVWARRTLKPGPDDWHTYHACDNAGEVEHQWAYKEVTLDARAELLIAGHSDGGFDNTLVEIKSIGLGTIRIDAPDLLERHQEGKLTDLTGLWRSITKPLRSHLIQGDIYLHLAHVLGLPFDQIVYLYEFKPNQLTKEFTIKYSPARVEKLVAKAAKIKYAVESGMEPECIKPGTCKQCNAFPRTRRTVARTRTDLIG